MLSEQVALTLVHRSVEQVGYRINFHKAMLKTSIRALDNVIIYIAMIINENYNSNMYCCMNYKLLLKLSTP